MTIKEALKKIDDNQKLIGNDYKGDEISELVIIPTNGENIANICWCLNMDEPYEQYLAGYTDFDIIALLNFPYEWRIDGVLQHVSLDKILSNQPG